ncbi:GGDEF domain-containing protein [Cellulomonas sp. P22]|uniref:GGDEF domain-containing protein n=1 Tax=Cellulomonas sp. P22 TaxID=3373189 RepID=UPI0037AD35A7
MSTSSRTLGTVAADRSFIGWVARRTPRWVRTGGLEAVVGRVLLVFMGAVLAISAPLLSLDLRGTGLLLAAAGTLLLLAGLSLRVRWRRLPRLATLVFPAVALLTLLAVALEIEGVATAYVGLIPLCFVYTGLFHHGSAGPLLLPLATVAYMATLTAVNATSWIRLAVYCAAWLAISATLGTSQSRQRAATELLHELSRTDSLTRLGNRRGLERRLERLAIGDCVVICDLDHFKRVNDAGGHAAGDVILERFASTLAQHLRGRDYAARFGGEEFVLLLARTRPGQALTAVDVLRAEWAEISEVTFSAGIASFSRSRDAAQTLAGADAALYRAKEEGRDCSRFSAWDAEVPTPRRTLPPRDADEPEHRPRGVGRAVRAVDDRHYGDAHA